MTHSRAEELNPSHRCAECGVLHFFIPSIKIQTRAPTGKIVEVPFLPLEVTLVADGLYPFKADSEPSIAAQVPLIAMVWGIPGNRQALYNSIMVLN